MHAVLRPNIHRNYEALEPCVADAGEIGCGDAGLFLCHPYGQLAIIENHGNPLGKDRPQLLPIDLARVGFAAPGAGSAIGRAVLFQAPSHHRSV